MVCKAELTNAEIDRDQRLYRRYGPSQQATARYPPLTGKAFLELVLLPPLPA